MTPKAAPASVLAQLGCGGMGEGEPLTGDGVTQGIVRIGDTVRRPLRPFSLTVQAYLAHLRDAGFTGAPGTRCRGPRRGCARPPGHRRPP